MRRVFLVRFAIGCAIVITSSGCPFLMGPGDGLETDTAEPGPGDVQSLPQYCGIDSMYNPTITPYGAAEDAKFYSTLQNGASYIVTLRPDGPSYIPFGVGAYEHEGLLLHLAGLNPQLFRYDEKGALTKETLDVGSPPSACPEEVPEVWTWPSKAGGVRYLLVLDASPAPSVEMMLWEYPFEE